MSNRRLKIWAAPITVILVFALGGTDVANKTARDPEWCARHMVVKFLLGMEVGSCSIAAQKVPPGEQLVVGFFSARSP
jgi:hypothetical protein